MIFLAFVHGIKGSVLPAVVVCMLSLKGISVRTSDIREAIKERHSSARDTRAD
jgi:hypothetical protein